MYLDSVSESCSSGLIVYLDSVERQALRIDGPVPDSVSERLRVVCRVPVSVSEILRVSLSCT